MPEKTMDEKQTKPEPAPAATPESKAAKFRLLTRAWIVLMGVSWAVTVFLSVMFIVFQVLNKDKAAEFLIETEGEIKKVSWPARKEYVGSAMIVVLVVAIVSGFLHFVDKYLSLLMQSMGVGF